MKFGKTLSEGIVLCCELSLPAQQACAEIGALHGLLASNPFTTLDVEVWKTLYGTTTLVDYEAAIYLMLRPLVPEQVEHILKFENRAKPLVALAQNHRLSETQLSALLDKKKAAKKVATALEVQGIFRDPTFSADFLAKVVEKAGGAIKLGYLALADEATEAEAIATFVSYQQTAGNKVTKAERRLLGAVVERFPALLPICVAPESSELLLAIACGNRQLQDEDLQHAAVRNPETRGNSTSVDFALVALAYLPAAHKSTLEMIAKLTAFRRSSEAANDRLNKYAVRPTIVGSYAEVADEGVVTWLVGRACSYHSQLDDSYKPAKTFELIAISENKLLSDAQKVRIHDDLRGWDVEEVAGRKGSVAAAALVQRSDKMLFANIRQDDRDNNPPGPYAIAEQHSATHEYPRAEVEAAAESPAKALCELHWRSPIHQWLGEQSLTTEQWRLLFQLVDSMAEVRILDVVHAVSSM